MDQPEGTVESAVRVESNQRKSRVSEMDRFPGSTI